MIFSLACAYVTLHLQLGRLNEARKLAKRLCNGESVQLWGLRITIEIRFITRSCSSPSDADLLSLFELLRQILTKVSVSKSEDLWLKALKFYANQRQYFDELVEISVASLAGGSGIENEFSLSSTIICFILQKDGIQQARDIYKRYVPWKYLALPHPGLALYRKCIDLETNLKNGLINARKLYESALASYEQNVSLWQDYYRVDWRPRWEGLYKHRDLHFYPSWAYTLPSWFISIPTSIMEAGCWVVVSYYATGYDPAFTRFLQQFLLYFFLHQMSIEELKQQGILEDRLQLLVNVTGAFRPGILTALVGVSGAGETTLMDVLDGRKIGGVIEGNVYVSDKLQLCAQSISLA
ncbi:hypothetical protein OROGR_018925 [Orobanche gracilis]